MTTPIYSDEIKKIYGADPRELPIYGLADTARYLKLHINTLRSWLYGRNYILGTGEVKKSLPVIKLPEPEKPVLSFINLVEVYVLSSITRIHNVRFKKVRSALDFLETKVKVEHPLATQQFWTDEFDLFVELSGDLICASKAGQMVMQEVIEQYLHRIDRDVDLTPFRIYPFSKEITFTAEKLSEKNSARNILEKSPKSIAIEPLVAFGRPTISGTGIATNVIVGRFNAGEEIEALAKDYDLSEIQVQEALEYEGIASKAA